MRINKLKLQNFKKFRQLTCDFNDDINIIAGDNESGKSSILEAIEICLNFNYRGKPLNSEISTDLFCNECIRIYLDGDLSQTTLPELIIEAHLEGNPDLKGDNNIERVDTEGIFVKIAFDNELAKPYEKFIENPDKVTTLPVEFYKAEWYHFGWDRLTYHNKGVSCLFVDPTRMHPTFGRAKYINSIINASLDKASRSTLNLNYRQLKASFDNQQDVMRINDNIDSENEISEKSLKITADIGSVNSWESSLQLAVEDVSFNQIGKGEQNQIQIKLALQNKAKDIDIVLLEEPENHLSHMNLTRLIGYLEKKNNGKQIFLTTHSSYVLNKLSLNKLCLLSDRYSRFSDIDSDTVKTLKRLPGYDTLRAILARKLVLVEGPSDELLLKKIYLQDKGHLPEDDGIDIIVVRGLGFKNYLNLAIPLKHPVRVVRDNDGNYESNVIEWKKDYDEYDFIKFYSPTDNLQSSLEPSLVESNAESTDKLDHLAKTMLSTKTYNKFMKENKLDDKKKFLKSWFAGEKTGGKKVDSAIRIFESEEEVIFPTYLIEAIAFD